MTVIAAIYTLAAPTKRLTALRTHRLLRIFCALPATTCHLDSKKLPLLFVHRERSSEGLPAVPYSATMSAVAQAHIDDLMASSRELAYDSSCNAHSWYNGPNKCCYDKRHDNPSWWVCWWLPPSAKTGKTVPHRRLHIHMAT